MIPRINVDLYDPDGKPVRKEVLENIISGCQRSVERSTTLKNLVKCFQVTFTRVGDFAFGSLFEVSFRDRNPLGGKKCLRTTFKLRVQTEDVVTSADEIEDTVCRYLREAISRLLKKNTEVSRELQTSFDDLEKQKT